LIAKLLERIGDHAERTARTYPTFAQGRLEPKLIKEMDAARESAMAILDKAFTALLTADIDAANEAVDDLARHQKLIDGLSHHVATRKGEELLALAAIVDSLGRTANYATDIAEIAVERMEPEDGEIRATVRSPSGRSVGRFSVARGRIKSLSLERA